MSSTLYDEHTLFVKCGNATKKQITDAFLTAFDDYTQQTGESVDCLFRVNVVTERDGTSLKIAFVFLTNPEFYYMFIGKNKDGSDRIVYQDNPICIPALNGSKINEAGWSNISPSLSVNKQAGPAKIAVVLDPLISLPPYELTEEQIEAKRHEILARNRGKEDFEPSLVEIPKFAYFTVDRARCEALDKKYMAHILKCRDVPNWLSKEELKKYFTPFVSDCKTLQKRTIKGQTISEAYPFVNINNDRVAFIIFDSSTNDASFALHMTKKSIFTNGTETATLVFNHSFRTERDIMADISQQPQPMAIPKDLVSISRPKKSLIKNNKPNKKEYYNNLYAVLASES